MTALDYLLIAACWASLMGLGLLAVHRFAAHVKRKDRP